MAKKHLRLICFIGALLVSSSNLQAEYKRSIRGNRNLLNKRYPKAAKFELTLPAVGFIPNQSYISSLIVTGSLGYNITETWGISVELSAVFNTDKDERFCLEHFYNDSGNGVIPECPDKGDDILAPLQNPDGTPIRGGNFGPIYAPIRELDFLAMASARWSPVYGKQIAFLSFTSYFDLYFVFGGGIAFSTFYPESLFLRNGTLSRGDPPEDFEGICPSSPGVCPDNAELGSLVGTGGRPSSRSETHPTITVGLGQKFHFLNDYYLNVEARNYTLVGTTQGWEAFYALWIGTGMSM